jgi:hypothetical protein
MYEDMVWGGRAISSLDLPSARAGAVDRGGKPCGPTLLACSCCGCGKGEEHKRSCYVWSNKWAAHHERQRIAGYYGMSPFMQALREERERVRSTPGRVPG